MFYKLGQLIVTRARLILALGVIALAVSAVLGVGVFGKLLNGGFDDPSSASSRATALLNQKFGGEGWPVMPGPPHRDQPVSDARAPAGQFASRRLEIGADIWNSPAGMADIA